ncbi:MULTISPECIES: DeoR/GlpR family DNA-binding transcription regulator [Paenibacillus]|uniref:GntR family transcriptional regulator n=1 Tax=Paenibacillus azoreducens TaxID=116718 RepID=A0A919Y6I9_9BACL|nr:MULTISPECIES: DeoR/GlpR family DNA-binding transcription regulator [Paenibacillus]MBE9912517.1 DeoR/GlpR transcriptional regulator [Paenibacillus donghaensis]GIO45861.1 GntR family transcriptional regulator [Paenibacillus azoreducens]
MRERNGSKEERQEQILEYILEHGSISLQEVIREFQCSEATARRDLEALEKAGRVIRTMGGGAKPAGLIAGREVPFHEKQNKLYREKESIAQLAASLVEEGDVIGLTGGTTTYLIARALKNRRNITVVTNAVNIAMELSENEDVQVVLTGGMLRSKNFELCGPLAERTLEALNIHIMFMGIDGFSAEQGVSTYSELEANTAQMMMKRTERTIAVFDHTKSGRNSLFQVAPVSALYGIITDQEPGDELRARLEAERVQVYVTATQ